MTPPTDPELPPQLVDGEKLVPFAVEAWKTTVSVQEHINDLELRIRNFAITFATAILGVVGLAIKEYPSSRFPLVLLIIGVVGWVAFYVMDRFWYHRFLEAAGAQAGKAEQWLSAATGTGTNVFNLAGEIKDASSVVLWKVKIRSKHRIDIFYGAFVVIAGILALALLTYVAPQKQNPPLEVVLKAAPGLLASPAAGTGPAPSPQVAPPQQKAPPQLAPPAQTTPPPKRKPTRSGAGKPPQTK